MALSAEAQKRLAISTTSQSIGREISDAINQGLACYLSGGYLIATVVVATDVSQTTDFGALLVGDKVLMIPAVAGNADYISISTAGDLGQAAVVGNAYVVLRAISAPTASSTTF